MTTPAPGRISHRGRALRAAAIAALALSGAAARQSAAPLMVVPASYRVGAGDILAMRVAGSPELDAPEMRVDVDGTVHIPFCDQAVPVANLNHDAIRQALQQALEKCQLAVKPSVEVSVIDVESKSISITGSVKQQEVIQAIEPIRLLDALTKAGGVSEYAGDQILVIQHQPGGGEVQKTYPAQKVLSSVGDEFNPLLTGGEEVRVMQGGKVYVSGAVVAGGAFPMNDNDPLTIEKVLALARGFAPAAMPNQIKLVHNPGTPGSTTEIIDMSKTMKASNGQVHDRLLASNDLVYVPVSTAKKIGNDILSRTASVVTTAAGVLLVQ